MEITFVPLLTVASETTRKIDSRSAYIADRDLLVSQPYPIYMDILHKVFFLLYHSASYRPLPIS